MSEPTTQAGRDMLALIDSHWVGSILDIEIEARKSILDAARESDGLRAALETLARACRDSFGKCRLCGVPASTMHEDDCPVDAAIGVLEPAYWVQRRAALDAARASVPALDVELLLDGIRDEVRAAVLEGDAEDCSSADCIADAVYEIVRGRLGARLPTAPE